MAINYAISRDGQTVATVTPTGNVTTKIMGEDTATMDFTLPNYVEFQRNDRCTIYGNNYVLQAVPDVEKTGRKAYKYQLHFVADRYLLANTQLLTYDEQNQMTDPEVSAMATAEQIIDLVIANLARNGQVFKKGAISQTDGKAHTFSSENCLLALTKLAETYATEFWITGNTINFTKQGADSGLSFKYGKGNGLRSISRKALNNKLATRLWVYGSDKNLPADYPGKLGTTKRLRMPGSKRYIEDPVKVARYGLIEESKVFEDIYPRRTGTVTAVKDAFTFIDSTLDFDLNAQLLPGVSAKINFQTGQVAGWTFEVREAGYNHALKQFTINVNKDEKAVTVPSDTGLKPAVGDTYIITDIAMPASYVANAATEMAQAGQKFYEENSDEPVSYTAVCDEVYLAQHNVSLRLGDYITIAEEQPPINKSLRILGLQRDLQNPYKVEPELGETVTISIAVKDFLERQQIIYTVKEAAETAAAARSITSNVVVSSQFITLTGEQVFSFSGDLVPAPEKEFVTLSAEEHNFDASPADRRWEYLAADGNWKLIVNSFNTLNLQVRHDSYIFEGRNSVTVRYRVGEVLDQLELVKLYAGQSALQVSIHSDFGDVFQNGNIDTVLRAEVSYGGELITDTLPESAFTWTRKSEDANADAVWNESHQAHKKEIAITAQDVWHKADFTCAVQYDTL